MTSASLFGSLADAASKAAAAAASAAKSAINSADTAAQAVSNGVSTVVGSTIILSAAAISNLGGSASDLFGTLSTTISSVPDGLNGFIKVDLAASTLLLTGQDPLFNASRDVFFMLYTNQNRTGQNVSVSNIGSSSFNSSNPTRVVIHGFLNNYLSPMNLEITKAYLSQGDFNVVSEKNQKC